MFRLEADVGRRAQGRSESPEESERKRVMRSMAHLWLEQEVRDLEGQVGALAPPFLVPHTRVLCSQLAHVRRLVATRRFVLVVPSHGETARAVASEQIRVSSGFLPSFLQPRFAALLFEGSWAAGNFSTCGHELGLVRMVALEADRSRCKHL